MANSMPQLCWRGYRAARDRSTVRTAALLVEWRYGVDERLRQPSWEGLVVTVRRYGSHGWSMGVDWEPARSLSALDPLVDVELESNRLHAEAARAGGPRQRPRGSSAGPRSPIRAGSTRGRAVT